MKNIIFNGLQQKELHNALMSAFPNRIALEKMLLFELDKQLEEIVGSTNLSDSIFTLIRTAISQGWLEDLVLAAHDSNPGNQLLFSFLRQHYLKSDRNVDYTKLRDFLKAGQWKDANHETFLVMLKVVGRDPDGWMNEEDLLNFPCTDIRTIDRLWLKYSNGHFGFSVQKKIYLEVGGIPNGKFYVAAWKKFGDRVEWRVDERGFTTASDKLFDTIAPVGHLPELHVCEIATNCGIGVGAALLFSRMKTCKL